MVRTSAEAAEAVRAWKAEKEAAERVPPLPAPEVPCRTALAGDFCAGARSVQAEASGLGWMVLATYARGTRRVYTSAGRVRSDRVVDSLALRCGHADGRKAVGCWADGRWDGGFIAGPDVGFWSPDSEVDRVAGFSGPACWVSSRFRSVATKTEWLEFLRGDTQ